MRFLVVFFLFLGLNLNAQQRYYFVAFKDKPNYKIQLYEPASYISIRAIERRTRNRVPLNVNDVPPDSAYLAILSELPLLMFGNSRWFNGTVVLIDNKGIIDSIKALPFVSKVTYVGRAFNYDESDESTENSLDNQIKILEQSFENKIKKIDTLVAGRSYFQINQLNDNSLITNGTDGKNVLIAVLDAGFKNVDKLAPFQHLFRDKKIVAAFDFVEKEEEVFEDDDHGLAVLSCLAAKQKGVILGTAPEASYLLLRSENSSNEYLVEEYFWALAAEYADSAGADIINSSLGYTKHDEKSMGHKFSELDGKTTIVTQAAEIAASKGILVVVSAGNEGDDPWRQISAPADGEHVLTVGAVDRFGAYVGFSSVGPTADKRMKPDLSAFGKGTVLIARDGKVFEGNGTSYACPLISGLAAQLLQLAPLSSAEKLKEVLVLSSNHYFKQDKYIGSGLPNMELAAKMIQAKTDTIIDLVELADNFLHITLFCRNAQKIVVTIKEPVEGTIEKVGLNLKKGLNRIVLKDYKKRPAGLYQLSAEFVNKIVKVDFIKP